MRLRASNSGSELAPGAATMSTATFCSVRMRPISLSAPRGSLAAFGFLMSQESRSLSSASLAETATGWKPAAVSVVMSGSSITSAGLHLPRYVRRKLVNSDLPT